MVQGGRRTTRVRVACVAVLAVALAGCGSHHEAAPSPTPTLAAVTLADAEQLQGQVGTSQLRVDVSPVQVTGDHAVLTLAFSVPASESTAVDVGAVMSTGSSPSVDAIRVLDLAAGEVWLPGTDSTGRPAVTSGALTAEPGKDAVRAVIMTAVPDVTSVDVLLPLLGLVRDVPVVAAGPDVPDVSTLGLAQVTYPAPVPITSFSSSWDRSSSVSSAAGVQTVTLGTDGLFDAAATTLSAAGSATVADAAARILKATSAARVSVTGYTDDQGASDADLTLSAARAQAVGARLAAVLGAAFPVSTAGAGQSAPVVNDSSDAARAANRRVEIRVASATAVPVSLSPAAAPAATVPTASGHDAVQFSMPDGSYFSAAVPVIARVDGYLVGRLTVTRLSGSPAAMPDGLLGDPDLLHQSYQRSEALRSGWAVSLIGTTGWIGPAEHLREADTGSPIQYVTPLTDRNDPTSYAVGTPVTYTVIWPDPGTDSVGVDVGGRFRITAVPVGTS